MPAKRPIQWLRAWTVTVFGLPVLLTLALGGTWASEAAPPRQQTAQAAQLTSTPAGGQDTLDTLQRAQIPPRDRIDLARRLLRIKTVPTPPSVPPVYKVGDTRQFRASNTDTDQDFTFTAKLWYATPRVYMWFQSDYQPDPDAVRRGAESFETRILPVIYEYFGREVRPGIDGDDHLYIVHVQGLGRSVGGYFDSDSEYSKSIVPSSNEAQLFFINLDTMGRQIGMPLYEGVLTHEMQHMVHANVDRNETAWLNEGLSELAAALAGYRSSLGFAPSFLRRPQTQLNAWSNIEESSPHYGAAYLFVSYFLQRFGEDALKALVAEPADGLESVAKVLRQIGARDPLTGKQVSVEDLFADWTVANLLNNPKAGDGRFAYSGSPTLPAPFIAGEATLDAPQRLALAQWGTTYLSISAPGRYLLSFQGESPVRVVPAEPHSGKKFWWSNRGDQIDTRLTRHFDLRGVRKATLNFWLWFATETDWDYGYVEVSTDGGQTWTALRTQDSGPAGGHRNLYGPAYTGLSAGLSASVAQSTPSPDRQPHREAEWRAQSLDLSAYTGKEILVRFEYITDDTVNEAGLLIDDISLPEIGYTSDAETGDDGWMAEGWVRIENVLPQRYLIQAVENDTAPRVFRLLGPADGTSGEWMLEVGGEISSVVLVLSGLTEGTTEEAAAQITVKMASAN